MIPGGIASLALRMAPLERTLIGYYHMVSDLEVPHVRHLYRYKNTEQFRKDLDWLLSVFKVISLQDFFAGNGRVRGRNSLLLTFDDGFREMYDVVLPILEQEGVSATFFVNSAFVDNKKLCYCQKASLIVDRLKSGVSHSAFSRVRDKIRANGLDVTGISEAVLSVGYLDRHVLDDIGSTLGIDWGDYLASYSPYLSSVQIEDMIRRGFSVGAHSIDHPRYSSLAVMEQLQQTVESVQFVRRRFGLNYGAFAFPHGDQGVRREFFEELHKSGVVDVTFGTGGLMIDEWSGHVQRISLEKPLAPARVLVARGYVRWLYRRARRRHLIRR